MDVWFRDITKLFWISLMAGTIVLGLLLPFYLIQRLLVLRKVGRTIGNRRERRLWQLAVLLNLCGLSYTAWVWLKFISSANDDGMIEIFESLISFAFKIAWVFPVVALDGFASWFFRRDLKIASVEIDVNGE
jgi:H+/Cl- antiporter ClcA